MASNVPQDNAGTTSNDGEFGTSSVLIYSVHIYIQITLYMHHSQVSLGKDWIMPSLNIKISGH